MNDENSTNTGNQENIPKGGIISTEKTLVENDVLLTGKGVADAPFVADDVIGENYTTSNVKNGTNTLTGNGQFGNDIQARATDDATEMKNKSVSSEEKEIVKVV